MDVVYTVKSGEWMAKIAEGHRTSVSAIWNHPDSAGHRAKRGSPGVLYPTDVLVRAMKALLRRLPEDVCRDRERCLAIQQAGSAQASPTT